MATINKRADEFAEKEYHTGSYEKERLSFGYYHGATEQQKIDIHKAWKLACDSYSQGVNGGLMMDIDTFTKYMEE